MYRTHYMHAQFPPLGFPVGLPVKGEGKKSESSFVGNPSMFNIFLHRSPKKNALGSAPSLSLIKMHLLAADLQMLCTTDAGCLLVLCYFLQAAAMGHLPLFVLSSKDTKNRCLQCLQGQKQLEWKHNQICMKSFPITIERWSLGDQG